MIRSESEYKEAIKRITEEKRRLYQQRKSLRSMGMTAPQIKRAIDPMRSFHLQLVEEAASYERLQRGEFDGMLNLRGLGHLLISLRIARRMSQRDLAAKMKINESQVSRDERNEYHGITLERAARILDALGVELRTKVKLREELEVPA